MVRFLKILPFLCILLWIGNIQAQQSHITLDWAPHKIGEGLTPFLADTISPVVHDDQTVTFTINAPKADDVLLFWSIMTGLQADSPVPFTKDENGTWSLTVGPLTPNIYKYKLIVDGVPIVDPSNTFGGFENQPGYSYVVVHGDEPSWYDAKNVPHGVVSRHIYHSDVLNGEREMFVYTPPGYDSSKEYPVLYLLGGSGEVAATWSKIGRINFIMDNLLAEGKAEPMIIAMPNNQVVHRSAPNHREKSFTLFNDEMVEEIIPFVEEIYSAKTDRHNRAIAGLSMGGRHAQVIGLNNLDFFASFGLLSAAESFDLIPGFLDDSDVNDKIDYLFVGAGTHETNPDSRHVQLHEELEENGIEHEYYIGSEGAHDFVTWKHLMYYEFLPKLWRENQ